MITQYLWNTRLRSWTLGAAASMLCMLASHAAWAQLNVEHKTLISFDAPFELSGSSSGSMRTKRTDVERAALAFVSASNPADELFLVNFNDSAYMGLPKELPFTSDVGQFQLALLQTSPRGLTALYDAVELGLTHLRNGKLDRKALVLLSDGGDNASRRKLDDVLEMARRSTATIYAIGIFDETDPDRTPRVLRKIAESTGGRAYFPQSLAHLEKVWREIASEIRSQYTIGYLPGTARDGSYRAVKIVATRNGGMPLKVTTRDGYIIPEN